MRLLAVLAVATLGLAQERTTPTEAIIKVDVNLIQIDVTVLDKEGKPFEGLTAKDFTVYRDGKKLDIERVLYVSRPVAGDLPQRHEADTLLGATGRKQLLSREVRRTIVIFVDDVSIRPANLLQSLEAIRHFIEKSIEPGDVVAIYRSSGGLGLLQQYTSDKQAMLAAVDRIRYRGLGGTELLNPYVVASGGTSGLIAAGSLTEAAIEQAAQRQRQDFLAGNMMSTAMMVVRGLRELPGRKSMMLFSESTALYDRPQAVGNPGQSPSAQAANSATSGVRTTTIQKLNGLIDMANRNGVTIYCVDPRGVVNFGTPVVVTNGRRPSPGVIAGQMLDYYGTQEGMARMADETGGRLFSGTNDLEAVLEQAARDQDAYYLLAFRPDVETFEKNKKGEAKIHRLTIKVGQPGLKVRYRNSFIGVTDKERITGFENPLAAALVSPFRAADLSLKMTPIYMNDGESLPVLRTFLYIDPASLTFETEAAGSADQDQTPWKKAVIEELVVLYGQGGEVRDKFTKEHTIRLRGKEWEAALQRGVVQVIPVAVQEPGGYQVRAAIYEKSTQRTGSAMQFVFVPDLKSKQIAMSDLALSSEEFLGGGDNTGTPGLRILKPGEKLVYGAYIYNARIEKASTQPNLETQVILLKDGKAVYTGPVTPFKPQNYSAGKPLSLMGNMALSRKIAPGEYVLQVAVRDLEAPKHQQVTLRSVDFEVRP